MRNNSFWETVFNQWIEFTAFNLFIMGVCYRVFHWQWCDWLQWSGGAFAVFMGLSFLVIWGLYESEK